MKILKARKNATPPFILVRPQMGENIGAAARAMYNFGLTDLRLVAPRDGWPNQAAIDNAAGALEEMNVRVFNTLEDAATDLDYLYATTARTRDIAKPVFTPRGSLKNKKKKFAWVFGPERTGLENDEIALCDAVLTIPSNAASPVLNLAQSVTLISYEWYAASDKTPLRSTKISKAPHGKVEEMLSRLENELDEKGFFKTKNLKPTMRRNIRTMLMRGEWSEQEIRTFHGIISALTEKKKKL